MQLPIEIGIPIYKGISFVEAALEQALVLPNVGRIHISVNEPGEESESIRKLALRDSRIVVTLQETNVGLYGNFRFLLEHAEFPLFSWLAFDDQHSKEAYVESVRIFDPNIGLYLPLYNYHKFDQKKRSWSELLSVGRAPSRGSFANTFGPDPSWIFGVWNTAFLKSIFPRRDFDWLDTYILSATILKSEIAVLTNIEAMKIGVSPGKSPHVVNGRWHGSLEWFLQSLNLIASSAPRDRAVYESFIRSSWGRFSFTWTTLRKYFITRKRRYLSTGDIRRKCRNQNNFR